MTLLNFRAPAIYVLSIFIQNLLTSSQFLWIFAFFAMSDNFSRNSRYVIFILFWEFDKFIHSCDELMFEL